VLRVAVADPLETTGLDEIHRATGLQIAPMVATLSSIGRAIQRYYHRSSTKVVPRPSRSSAQSAAPAGVGEIETDRHFAEPTKKVDARTAEAMTPGTVPMYSIEEEASVEVRLRALLMALEDKGLVTHAEFVEALRKVLGVG